MELFAVFDRVLSCKQVALLNTLVANLLDITSQPLPSIKWLDQSRDVVQVHAIHMLRSVVQESRLSAAVSQFYVKLTIRALDGFMSPLWTIRNASLQLLG